MSAPIVFITDFGHRDWYAGTLKGVALEIAPEARIIDLTHAIDPGDVSSAAFALEASYRYFPEGTVFCCVVDPGVGTDRAGLCATDRRYFFVAPDNGLLGRVAGIAGESLRVYRLENQNAFLKPLSATFHGRDIFTPVAARLARGAEPAQFGPQISAQATVPLEHRTARFADEGVFGRIVYIDTYGNLFTNIVSAELTAFLDASGDSPGKIRLRLDTPAGFRELAGMARTFGDHSPGEALFYPGSSGYVEIAVNQGRADEFFGVNTGAAVQISNNSDPAAL